MATVTLRQIKGSPLTNAELDANLTNINAETVDNSTAYRLRPSLDVDLVGSKTVSPLMSFSRGSTGTYYDGKTVAKAEENLLFYSQDLSVTLMGGANIWQREGTVSATANYATAPDGTMTATRVVLSRPDTASYSRVVQHRSIVGVNTSSIWLKTTTPGTTAKVTFRTFATGSEITVTDTWQRFTATNSDINSTTAGSEIMISGATNDLAVDVLAWGAQLEQRSQPTAYTPTTTAPITNYIPQLLTAPAGIPRFDHDVRQYLSGTGTVSGSTITLPATFLDGTAPSASDNYYIGQSITVAGTAYTVNSYVGSTRVATLSGSPTTGSQAFNLANPDNGANKGLLIEESRTNAVVNSSDFSAWTTTSNFVLTPNSNVAPDGTLTATRFVPNSGATVCDLYKGSTSIYTGSLYVKADGWNIISLYNGYNSLATFNLSTNTIGYNGGSNGKIEDVGNGWKRLSFKSGETGGIFFIRLSGDTGNGYKGVYIWGAQAESVTTPTSYIPTTTTAVTRSADQLSISKTSNWFNSVNGTLALAHDAASGQPLLGDGSTTMLSSLGAGTINIDYSNSQLSVVTQSGQTTATQGIFNFDSDLQILGNSTTKANARIKYMKFYPNNVIGSTPEGSGFILDDGYAMLQEDGSVLFQE